MMTIHKYELRVGWDNHLLMPVGATVLDIQRQGGQIMMWAHVDTQAVTHKRRFHVIGTGHEVPAGLEYLKTVQVGGFVWHIFEEF